MAIYINGVEQVAAGVDSGVITIWHGTIANIPAGWVICDGNSGTPNLLTKFIQGVATAATDPGATGGEATHTLSTSEIPAHSHAQRKSDGGSNPTTEYPSQTAQDQISADISDTASTGGGSAHQNEPTFYDVAFIMKT